jgi:hypothetical protein
MTLAVAAWPLPGVAWTPTPATDRDRDRDGHPPWHRGDEVESQAFLAAMGIELE